MFYRIAHIASLIYRLKNKHNTKNSFKRYSEKYYITLRNSKTCYFWIKVNKQHCPYKLQLSLFVLYRISELRYGAHMRLRNQRFTINTFWMIQVLIYIVVETLCA